MRKIQFVCDRCGAVLEGTAVKVIPNVVKLESEDILHPVDEATHGMHFCTACVDVIMKLILPEKTKAPENIKPPPKAKRKPVKRRRLDAGRVMALHHAGWSNEEIADDIHAEAEQVRQCIYYQKYKKKGPTVTDGKERE